MKILLVLSFTLMFLGTTQAQGNPKTVKIGKQTWMVKNLDVVKYRNGDPIPKVSNKAAWAALTTGAWCYYDDDSSAHAFTYGKLYNWYAINDPRGLAPKGWHIPTDTEWTTLTSFLGGVDVASSKMKEAGTTHWKYNKGATNASGFTALPGGYSDYFGSTNNITYNGYWWSSTKVTAGSSNSRLLDFKDAKISSTVFNNNCGLSVRCLKN